MLAIVEVLGNLTSFFKDADVFKLKLSEQGLVT